MYFKVTTAGSTKFFVIIELECVNQVVPEMHGVTYSISEILAMCRKKRSPTSTLEKVTLNYLIFLILYKYRIFCHLFFFQNLAIFGFVL